MRLEKTWKTASRSAETIFSASFTTSKRHAGIGAVIVKIVRGVAQKLGGGDRAQLQLLVAGLDPRQDQQVLGEPGHARGILADDLQKITQRLLRVHSVQQGLGISLDRGQRGAQFVRDVGDEIAARRLDAFRLGEVVQNGDQTAGGHGGNGGRKHASGNKVVDPRRDQLVVLRRLLNGGQKIRVAHGLHHRLAQADAGWA